MGITKILCSPLIRTVMTADLVAEQLGLGPNSICIEMSMVEEAKSFRGKTAAEPRPNFNPLLFPPSELARYSNRINMNHVTIMDVKHERDLSMPNTLREVHETLTDRDEITKDRCRVALRKILEEETLRNEVVLFVGHGATVKCYALAMEAGLPDDQKIQGERTVSCFGHFGPVDPSNPLGQWRAITPMWGTGDIDHTAAEVIEDQGISSK
jgi:broad specificity phosphatase PhoE